MCLAGLFSLPGSTWFFAGEHTKPIQSRFLCLPRFSNNWWKYVSRKAVCFMVFTNCGHATCFPGWITHLHNHKSLGSGHFCPLCSSRVTQGINTIIIGVETRFQVPGLPTSAACTHTLRSTVIGDSQGHKPSSPESPCPGLVKKPVPVSAARKHPEKGMCVVLGRAKLCKAEKPTPIPWDFWLKVSWVRVLACHLIATSSRLAQQTLLLICPTMRQTWELPITGALDGQAGSSS